MEILKEKWEEILQTVKKEHDMTDIAFNTWLKPLELHSVTNGRAYILVTGERIGLNYMNKHYYLPIKVAIAEITGTEYEIEFILPEQAAQLSRPQPRRTPTTEAAERSNLNPNYTFDTFVVGSNNRFAHSAAMAVAENPGHEYNPLFIYGGVGLGKTHLMHSVAHYVLETRPELKVLYVTSESFTNELIESIRNGNTNAAAMTQFREKYRSIDVLLIDDVQFIIGKDSTQEEFFHTFNELHIAKKQIVLSSDRPPKEMVTLAERIRSRFEWGLLADIGSPDYETRMAILRKKEERDGFHIDDDILNYIAINIKSNIRELEGALNKLVAYRNLVNEEITMEVAVKELQNFISPDAPKEITAQTIIEVVTDHFNLTMKQMMSSSRSSNITRPRQIAMYLCKEMTDETLTNIAHLLGKKDHSTVISGIKKVEDEMKTDPELARTVEQIRKKINPV